jgi:hypothetical protein
MSSKGLVVIGVTDEPPELVDGWVEAVKAEFPIAALANKEFERFLEVGFFPTAAVISPDGTLAYSGSAGMISGPLDKAMSKAEKGSIWPKKLSKVVSTLSKGDENKAYGALLKLIEGGKLDEETQSSADFIKEYLEGRAESALKSAETQTGRNFILKAVRVLEPYAEASPPYPATPKCVAMIEKLEAMPTYKKEIKGGEKVLEAEEVEGEGDFTEAFEIYKSVTKKYEGTKIADLARTRAEVLIEEGMIGFQVSCNNCRRAKKACPRHKEEASL